MHLFWLNDSFARRCALNQTEFADGYRLALVGFFGSFVAVRTASPTLEISTLNSCPKLSILRMMLSSGITLERISILANFLLFYVFSTSRKLRRQNYANPVLLALSDIIVSFCYVLMTSTQVIIYRAELVPLIHCWAMYMRFTYCLQHVALTVSNFLLVIASIERYLASNSLHTHKRVLVFMVKRKIYVILTIFALSLLFKASLFLETSILRLPDCPELESVIPVWIHAESVGQSIRFWIRKVFTIIFPFLILAYCNIRIVTQLRHGQRESAKKSLRKSRRSRYNSGSVKRRYNEKKGVRIATRTLVMVVGCYLFSNSLTTVINIWEFFDAEFLRYANYYSYLLCSDFASLLTICGCALRLPIYVVNDHRIRKAIWRAFLRCRYRRLSQLKEIAAGNLEKWSIVIVSNSLRSNLTNANGGHSQMDYNGYNGKKSYAELARLLQNRRRLLVEMTITLSAAESEKKPRKPYEESTTGDISFLTDIQEEDTDMLAECRRSLMLKQDSLKSVKEENEVEIWRANI
ncbi:hypothetical protein L596_027835 [Steinernema carpocapsae]|uniref:G-protein coupled receptors family 1 profile domain-containing protein n=1 Tax=Steinernema carpocapsae TaxID=34508 RepID=A0A4U5LWQ5_STECR|nr:hypothetical protein L596_027835 [Steinernema carpocapsae]